MLNSIEIKNFKSIKNQRINFDDLNILIGANNSGKSNLLDGIVTINNIFKKSIDEVFGTGPFSFGASFCKGGKFEENMSFKVKGKIGDNEYEYEIELEGKRKKTGGAVQPSIKKEKLTFNGHQCCNNSSTKNSFIYTAPLNDLKDPRTILKRNFRSMEYQFVPKLIKKDHQIIEYETNYGPDSIPYLSYDGSNLLDVLYYVRELDDRRFAEIFQSFRKFFPNLKNLKIQTGYGGNSVLQVNMKIDNKDWRFVGPQLSDGFLILLSIITLLSSEQLPNVILFEELENGLNPSSIEKILNRMFEVVRDKDVQICITTHSPMFLQLMRNRPESIIICEQDEYGFSTYTSLKEKVQMFKEDYQEGESLIDLWFSGLIGGL